jgi:nickel superoxide dismutase
MTMKKRFACILGAVLVLLFWAGHAAAHCEIPCGIYDDEARIKLISEHITTMEKSMKEIARIKGKTPVNYNQLVRWIVNKEHHADALQEIVTQYFMTQRIKSDTPHYDKKLGLLHKMLVRAMKCKQTLDLSHIQELRSLLKAFQDLYFGHTH